LTTIKNIFLPLHPNGDKNLLTKIYFIYEKENTNT
jgi:hypothetical protein